MNALVDELARTIMQTPPPARGRKPASIAWGTPAELTEDDIFALHSPTKEIAPHVDIKQIRHRHHFIARLIAEGRKHVEISAIASISQSRISVLLQDPAFAELVAYYKDQVRGTYLNVHEKLANIGVTAMEELQDRLDTSPETFKNKDLKEIIETTMDRSAAPSKAGTGIAAVKIVFVDAPEAPRVLDITPTISDDELNIDEL